MILVIRKVKEKSFTGQDGERIEYFWTTAEKADGMAITFGGTVDHSAHIGESLDILIEAREKDGKQSYFEVPLE